MKCEDCGKTEKQDPSVSYRTCGYSAEIHGSESWHTVCDSCEHEHCMDI